MSERGGRNELTDRIAELETQLEDLQDQLQRPPRGPFGLPRPPSPRELLRATDEVVIPTAIAILEANIRTLELLQRTIRLADSGRRVQEEGASARDRATELSRETLTRLEAVLDDLSEALETGGMPQDPEARSIVEDARRLSREINSRLAPSEADVEPVEASDHEPAGADEDRDVSIDVESELESIKSELDGTENGDDPDNGDSDDTTP
ncbi:MAG: hypothetical protein ABEI76_05410 [Halobacteriales archaeon]